METNKYRTSGVIDESTFREINKVALSRKYIWFTRTAAVVMVALALLVWSPRNYFYSVFLAVLAVLLLWFPRRVLKSSQDIAVKRLRENNPAGYMQMETWFTEEGLALHNLTTGAQLTLPYGTLQRVAETERYFYLVTKANQFSLVFKELLTPEQQRSFLPFLQGECPSIKVVR